MKYYPYHLDKNYDDEKGNPYNYGFDDDEEDKDDNWWRWICRSLRKCSIELPNDEVSDTTGDDSSTNVG